MTAFKHPRPDDTSKYRERPATAADLVEKLREASNAATELCQALSGALDADFPETRLELTLKDHPGTTLSGWMRGINGTAQTLRAEVRDSYVRLRAILDAAERSSVNDREPCACGRPTEDAPGGTALCVGCQRLPELCDCPPTGRAAKSKQCRCARPVNDLWRCPPCGLVPNLCRCDRDPAAAPPAPEPCKCGAPLTSVGTCPTCTVAPDLCSCPRKRKGAPRG